MYSSEALIEMMKCGVGRCLDESKSIYVILVNLVVFVLLVNFVWFVAMRDGLIR